MDEGVRIRFGIATFPSTFHVQNASQAVASSNEFDGMASAIVFGATSGGFIFAAGAAAHGVLASRQLSGKQWDPSGRGGFIGSIRGGKPAAAPVAPPPVESPPATGGAAAAPKSTGSVVKSPRDAPIGGATGKPSPPTPFGRFRNHKPTKLPKGCPKPYDASKCP